MIGAVAALALFGGLFHFDDAAARNDVQIQHYGVAGWRLAVRHDRFTDTTTCTIERPDIVYSHGLIDFRFGHSVDTANALFRVDDGVPRTVGSVAVKAAALGAHFSGPNMANPTNGEVHIPADELGGGVKISIQPNRKMTHRNFDLTGLSVALKSAAAMRCDVI